MKPSTSLLLAALFASPVTAFADDADDAPPGVKALEQFRDDDRDKNPVRNRFFVKEDRMQFTPAIGYVPNNPFSRRYNFSLALAYHLSENISAQARFDYAPDLAENDLKPLTAILLDRATEDDFAQPLDKVVLGGSVGLNFSPFYGKINLIGETVLAFDFYGHLGAGVVVQREYSATEAADPPSNAVSDVVDLTQIGAAETRFAPILGLGGNFFVTQSVALNIDGRFHLIIDDAPTYDLTVDPGNRLLNMFTASVGLSLYFPKMDPRKTDF